MEKTVFRPLSNSSIQLTNTRLKPQIQQGFAKHLQNAVQTNEGLSISKHAQKRLSQRKQALFAIYQRVRKYYSQYLSPITHYE